MNMRPDREAFSEAFRTNYWGGKESSSGPGSSLEQTLRIRTEIPHLLRRFGVKAILDIPCGDFFWMKDIQPELGAILSNYIGADIVPELIEKNRECFETSKFRFVVLNLTKDELPKVDLVMIRDCFIHLSFTRIAAALGNAQRSGATYLLASTYTKPRPNVDVEGVSLNGRAVNLAAWPFRLPEPIELINEGCSEQNQAYSDKSLGLWRLQELDVTGISRRVRLWGFWYAFRTLFTRLMRGTRRVVSAVSRKVW